MSTWSDDRLDEEGFAQVPTRGEMNQHIRHLDARFDRRNHTFMVAGATILAAILATGFFG